MRNFPYLTVGEAEARRADIRTYAGFRSVRRNPRTGTFIVVLDDREQGDESDPDVGRWTTLCDDHGTLIFHDTLRLAEWHAADPEGWCEECREISPAYDSEETS